jgi:glycosyltransferase involved in cell wall biosynthesis
MKICYITKNKFYLEKDLLISSGLLWYEETGILGFKFEEIEKLVLIGFKTNGKFDGYVYNRGSESRIFVVGPKFREEKRYILDRLINIFLTLKEIWKNREVLKDVDLVFAPFFEYVVFEFLLLKLICKKAKFVVYIIGDYPERNYKKRKNLFLKNFLKFAQWLSVNLSSESWFISEYLLKRYGNKNSIVIRSSSIKKENIVSNFKKFNLPFILVFVGRIEQDKNPLLLPVILKKIQEKGYNVRLKILGDGPLKEKLIEKINKLNLEKLVDFYGWVKDKEKIFEILDESSVLLLPSIAGEGTPLVFFEAFSRGLPIISTKFPGAEEVIEDGINGYLVDYSTDEDIVNQFVDRIEFLIKNPRIYEQMSKNNIEKAREWTMEKFSKIQRERVIKLVWGE